MTAADNVRGPDVVSPPIHPSLALGAYAGDLVAGARVALFGDATLSLTSELVERGARLVHVFDVDAVRAAKAGAGSKRRSVVYGTLPPAAEPSLQDASFDLVLIPDLSFTRDPHGLIQLASRLLTPRGAALIASPNPEASRKEALGYYDLYDAVRKCFRRVRMIGQARFSGYLLAEFSATEATSAAVDTSLASRPEPEFFVALASHRDVRLEPYAIVELPSETSPVGLFDTTATIPVPPPSVAQQALEAAKTEAERRAELAIAERNRALEDRDALRAQLRQLEHSLAQERKRAGEAQAALLVRTTELAEREGEVARLNERLEELEQARAQLEAEVAQFEAEVVTLEARLRERAQRVAELQREAERRERLVRELVSQVVEELEEGELRPPFAVESEDVEREEVAEAEAAEVAPPEEAVEADEAEATAEAGEEAEAPAESVAEEPPSEPSLRPESAAVPTQVAETQNSEPVAQDGVNAEALAELQEKLERLAQQAAHREADLVAARWKIAELEHKLAEAAGRER